jgi:O-methyltransferase involved in polyketide biosynthesis
MSMPVQLEGVPETLLWTLYHRASEARRSDAVLQARSLLARFRP